MAHFPDRFPRDSSASVISPESHFTTLFNFQRLVAGPLLVLVSITQELINLLLSLA
jgi:hypothetical protein